MPLKKRRVYKETKIEIIPMIDTMFFLLVFFILASLNVIDMKGAQVHLPTSSTQDQQAYANLTITIKQPEKAGMPGEIWVNKTEKVATPDGLPPVLLQLIKDQKNRQTGGPLTPEETIVVINADRKAPYSMVRSCIEAARRYKFRKFSIATDPKFDAVK